MELTDGLPSSVADVAQVLARWAKGYNNHLQWHEKQMFKADLMNARPRWHGVSPSAFAAKLRQEGMRAEDIAELMELLRKAQAGRRLVPHRIYRNHTFGPLDDPDYGPLITSPDWR